MFVMRWPWVSRGEYERVNRLNQANATLAMQRAEVLDLTRTELGVANARVEELEQDHRHALAGRQRAEKAASRAKDREREAVRALKAERKRFDDLLEKYHALKTQGYAPRAVEASTVVPPVPEPEERMQEKERLMAVEQMAAAMVKDGVPAEQAKAEAQRLIGDIFAPVGLDDVGAFL